MFSCLLAMQTKKHFSQKERWRLLNLGNSAYSTTESSQHCFLGAHTENRLLRKQNVSEKSQKHIFFLRKQKNVCATNVSFAHKQGNIEENVFPQQCFVDNNVYGFWSPSQL